MSVPSASSSSVRYRYPPSTLPVTSTLPCIISSNWQQTPDATKPRRSHLTTDTAAFCPAIFLGLFYLILGEYPSHRTRGKVQSTHVLFSHLQMMIRGLPRIVFRGGPGSHQPYLVDSSFLLLVFPHKILHTGTWTFHATVFFFISSFGGVFCLDLALLGRTLARLADGC